MKAALEVQSAQITFTPPNTTPYETVLALVKSAEFRANTQAALSAGMRFEGDRGYINGILEQMERCPWLLQEDHAGDWEGSLLEIYFAPDYGEYLSDDD